MFGRPQKGQLVRAVFALTMGLAIASPATAGGRASSRQTDGWQRGSYRVSGRSPVLVGTRTSNGAEVYVARIDHALTRLALYPGLSEPPNARPRGSGEVPYGQRWRLLATFNGGFKASAGAGGFLVNGRIDEPLRNGLGTLVESRKGKLSIVEWHGGINPYRLAFARQNLPPLVWAGRPTGASRDATLWGATLGGGTAVWRTAVGMTATGDLVYAAGDGQTPQSLATVMVNLHAVRAIELDINPEWPSFITYKRRGGRDPVQLVPNPQQRATRYLTPDARDFFAIYTRAGAGPSVPFH